MAAKPVGMAEFSLPAPWGAPDSEHACARCGRITHHYGRRVTLVADEESDRRSGRLEWFCSECGHRYQQDAIPDRPSRTGDHDGVTELFDRH